MTNIESWMVQVLIALVGMIGTYAVLRNRVARLEEDFKKHGEDSSTEYRDNTRKLDTQFRRIDEVTNRCTILEQGMSSRLDIDTAEAKFVSKNELDLHLKLIESNTANIKASLTKMEDKLEGKFEELLSLLSENILKGK